ncbi:MAG: site-2 protease family protein [Victivallaceae bacterium]|nr:site-2 protease family protein [Victivallaceae bacterium]
MNLFITLLWENPREFFMWIFIVVFAICCHEYMHARAALWQGDPTAADEGHLTLNPLRQMGPMSLVMLALLGLAWGQVPVNPARMRHKYSEALVSFAGPATNLALCLGFSVLAALVILACGLGEPHRFSVELRNSAVAFLNLGAMLNFVLFVFNLLPVPCFDGWHIICAFFPKLKTSDSQAMIFVVLVILLLGMKYIDWLFLLGATVSRFLTWSVVTLAQTSGV